MRRGTQVRVDSAGQNRRVPVFGALDLSGELSCMITERKRSVEFLAFLEWLTEEVYAEQEHIFLFMDQCSIHKTKAVRAFYEAHRDQITVIWNATYAPNLNDIERVWGHVKKSSINNYYFETLENLENAVLRAVGEHNRKTRCRHRQRPMFHSLRRAA